MSVSVASVTTAYNAERILCRQMDALLRQTRPLQQIVIVDNASTDGTVGLLAERYPQVTVLRMPQNLGAAGAWAAGLAYALEKRHDWVWAFDDDSVPSDNALEALLAGVEELEHTDHKVGIVAPLPVHRETGACYSPLLWREGFVKPSAKLLRRPIWFPDLVIASGCMVRRDVVETIGLPRADFFMDFFDFEYCLRARSLGFKIAVVTRATLLHEIGNAQEIRLAGRSRVWADQAPWREYYVIRNLVYAMWWLYPSRGAKQFAVRQLARRACGSILFGSNKLACLRKMAQGFLDGRKAILGIRFRPG